MRDEMKRTMFELFGVGSEDDKVLAAGGQKACRKAGAGKDRAGAGTGTACGEGQGRQLSGRGHFTGRAHCAPTAMWRSPEHSRARSLPPAR